MAFTSHQGSIYSLFPPLQISSGFLLGRMRGFTIWTQSITLALTPVMHHFLFFHLSSSIHWILSSIPLRLPAAPWTWWFLSCPCPCVWRFIILEWFPLCSLPSITLLLLEDSVYSSLPLCYIYHPLPLQLVSFKSVLPKEWFIFDQVHRVIKSHASIHGVTVLIGLCKSPFLLFHFIISFSIPAFYS